MGVVVGRLRQKKKYTEKPKSQLLDSRVVVARPAVLLFGALFWPGQLYCYLD